MRPLFALWQFGSVGMLAWGIAAALPILIHLWSRRKYRQHSWAAMTFLLAAMRNNARRIQLQQWILLAVRTAILVLFALALADPRSSIFSQWAGGASSGQTHVVLVIDASYSMDFRQTDQSRFEAAKEWSKQLVARGQQGDGYTLILMAEPPRVVIGQPAFEKQDVLQEIDNLSISHGGASLPATLAEIETTIRQAGERSAQGHRLSQRRICILSDLQQATWNEATSADCRAQLARLENLASLELIDLGQPGDSNLAVANLRVDSRADGLVTVGSPVQLQVEMQSFSREDRPRVPVEIIVDGQRVADERIDCPSGGRAAVVFEHRFEAPGEHMVEARLADDALLLDNRRWLSVPVRDRVRVLLIGGHPGETRHLALALAPKNDSSAAIDVVQAPESRLVEGDLTRFHCLIVCNIGRFSREEAAVLHRFALRGGGVMMFLGDQVQAENYNQLLADDAQLRLLPARLGEVARAATTYAIDPLEYRHPIVAPFRGFPQSGLLTTPIWKYVRLTPIEGAKTALALGNGDPAIVETQIGRGKCILVATAASPDSADRGADPPTPWTALATWPSFPPLVHEMLRLAISGQAAARNVTVGDELSGVLPPAITEQNITLSGPGGLRERLPIRTHGGEAEWSFAPARVSGAYEARAGGVAWQYAVNLDPREGDLSRIDPDLLPARFRRDDGAAESSALANPASAQHFRWLLAAVLVLLVIEPCLAWHFGRGRG